ncbi:tRNA (adenosine(37)-N6)-threonylcarbamoyltransferase complex dimerization subunit type 1 TsaB [Corynebacterium pseudopelargi]|uniref:tRNA threonylcarbamoyladenosine biosynthesis protein TsaB n=1 Tax=Corynebacterium pseudopelargi TaxID=2080757 RepID=A0A3G6IVX8_9CORY|nr:tRNA (adenosine(37)-N6)-threonylcarbamoyltransferase complex dimerization subunit type 1 TsaB [Corynebacterium pseudopelargi]AZA09931.1 tRNA threonylcarbamoyladenosine biosynthesis protein TsaB [Corynebacterium pseudopelargi]
MLLLTVDSATPRLVLGLVRDAKVLEQRCLEDARRHNEALVPTVMEMLEATGLGFDDLQAVVVGCGPGPFTGLRVGMVSAMAFADALGIPVTGVSSHQAIASQLPGSKVLVVTDARRKEVYYTEVVDGQVHQGPQVCKPADLPAMDVDTLSVPQHLQQAVVEQVNATEVVECYPSAQGLAAVAQFDPPQTPEPLYLRRPDAKEPQVQLSSAIPHHVPTASPEDSHEG